MNARKMHNVDWENYNPTPPEWLDEMRLILRHDDPDIRTAMDIVEHLLADRDDLVRYVRALKELVDKQAENDGLWFVAQTITEEYLQAGLRVLHARVETYETISQELKNEINANE